MRELFEGLAIIAGAFLLIVGLVYLWTDHYAEAAAYFALVAATRTSRAGGPRG